MNADLQTILKELKGLREMLGVANRRLLTIEEAATYIGLSPRTIRNGIGAGAAKPFPVKSVKVGGRRLFRREDLDSYIDGLGSGDGN
ncbi:MAG: helix-turn-helix domain-containing protein [Thermodesulfobacteriota bacterium]